jgi:hypothetical protein
MPRLGPGLAALALSSLGCTAPTTTLVTVARAPGLTIASLGVTVQFEGVMRTEPLAAAAVPGSLLVRTPDVADLLTVTLFGVDDLANPLTSTGSVRTVPHQRTTVTVTLGAPAGADGGAPAIAWRATRTASVPMSGATSITVGVPTHAPGDLMVAAIAIGSTGSATAPTIAAPPAWTLVRRLDRANDTTLAVYRRVATSGEPADYSWSWNGGREGPAWISSYSGVDPLSPIEAEDGRVVDNGGPAYSTPAIDTASANAMVIGTFASHAGQQTTWTPQSDAAVRASFNNGSTRSGLSQDLRVSAPTAGQTLSATASTPQDYCLVHILALRPAGG